MGGIAPARHRWMRRIWDGVQPVLDTRWLPFIFLLFAVPTGLRLALLTPIGQVADEPTHIARADGLLYGQLLGHRLELRDPVTKRMLPFSGVFANDGVVTAAASELAPGPPRKLSAARLARARAIKWSKHLWIDICPNTVQYFPLFYLPGSAGIALAHAAGLSPLAALFAGRIGMLCGYLAMGFAALGLAAWGRGVLFSVLLMPMTISLGASFNQDGQLIAATALACALLTRDPSTSRWMRWGGVVLLVLLIMSKPPYGLLLLVALVPLAAPHLFPRAIRLSLFAIPPVIWVALVMHFSMVPFNAAPYHPGRLWPGVRSAVFAGTDPQANLRVLFSHPFEIVALPLRLLWSDGAMFLREAVGQLGWLSIPLRGWQYGVWYVSIAAALAGCLAGRSSWKMTFLDHFVVALLIVASVFAIAIAQYLSWTHVGLDHIDGVQGRYFLILMPFLIFVVPRRGGAIDRVSGVPGLGGALEMMSAVPAIVMAGIDVHLLPVIVERVFY